MYAGIASAETFDVATFTALAGCKAEQKADSRQFTKVMGNAYCILAVN